MTDYKREHRGAQRVGTDMPKDTGEPDAQAEHELSALDDLPLYEPVGRLPSGHLVLTDAAGALYVAGFATSLLEGDDSDEPCPICHLIHEVIDDDEAPGDGGQGHERPEPETGAPRPEPASEAEPADPLLHTHRREPGGVPMHHAHPGGDKPHAHKLPRKPITTGRYRLPKPAPTPKTGAKATAVSKAAAKATPAPKVPTQATPVRMSPAKQPTKGGRRRVIVTSAWHAHRAASEHDRREQQ